MVATATGTGSAGVDSSRMTIYQSRWSAKRLRDIANAIKGKKRDVISKSSFGDLLYISPFLPPPEELVDFLVMRIDTNKRLLKINENKKIHLTRDMVKKIFNVPSGCKPLEFGKRRKADLREVYLDGERAPIPSTISVLSKADDNDEETIERTWALLCLALVLTPGTGNMVPLDYLYTFRDMSVVHEFAFDEHILADVMKEVKKYQDRRNEGKGKFLIGGCLPMIPVIYMDHLDVPRACIVDHTINYSLPRACFVHEMDFYAIVAVDTLDDGFGKRPFSSSSPYGTPQFMSYVDQLAQGTNKVSVTEEPSQISDEACAAECATDFLGVPESSKMQSDIQGEAIAGSRDTPHAVSGGTNGSAEHADEATKAKNDGYDNVCGSLEEWLHAIPLVDELELPPHMQATYNKHKEIHAAEVNTAFSSFGRVLQGMYCKRLGLMLSEVNKAQCKLHEQKDGSEDVTFSVPGGASAAGCCHATGTEPPPPPQQPNSHPGAHGAVRVEGTTATEPTQLQPKEPRSKPRVIAVDTEPAVDVAFDIPAPTKMNDHNNENVHNNDTDQSFVKVSEQCNKVKNIGQESSRSPSHPSVNLVRRPGTLEDGPSFGLFEPGSDDAILFHDDPAVSFASDLDPLLPLRARSPLFDESPATSAGPIFDVTPLATCPPVSTGPAEATANDTREEVVLEVSSGRKHVENKPTPKREATSPESGRKLQKMKKLKVDATDDAIYKQYCCTSYQIKDPPEGEPLPPFIRIGGFDVSFKHFSNGLKKRAQLNNEVMSLYIESFNIEHMYSSTKPKKFAVLPHTASKLAVDPKAFDARSCIKDFERACNKNNIAKCDQLFFTIVQKGHWAVVVANLIQKQFNVFDSSTDSDYVSPLENACSNLIANFKTLVRNRNPWKHNLDTFERFSPDGYPQQSTIYDCGFFSILYMENLTTRGMKPFNTDTKSMLNFRTYIAAKLFKHPQNTLNSAEEFQALLKKS